MIQLPVEARSVQVGDQLHNELSVVQALSWPDVTQVLREGDTVTITAGGWVSRWAATQVVQIKRSESKLNATPPRQAAS